MPMHSEMKRVGMSPGQPPFGRLAVVCSQEVSARLRTIPDDDLCLRTATVYAKFELVLKYKPWRHELGPINEERLLAVVRSNV